MHHLPGNVAPGQVSQVLKTSQELRSLFHKNVGPYFYARSSLKIMYWFIFIFLVIHPKLSLAALIGDLTQAL